MNKLVILALILASALAFNINKQPIISEEVDKQLEAINWPFTTCGDGKWDIQKLTLSSTPARNTNDSIDVVSYFCYHRPVPPEPQSPSRMFFWMLSWTEPHSIPKASLSLMTSIKETPLNSSSTTTSHHSPHQEPTDLLSNSLTIRELTTDASHSSSNYDLYLSLSLSKISIFSSKLLNIPR